MRGAARKGGPYRELEWSTPNPGEERSVGIVLDVQAEVALDERQQLGEGRGATGLADLAALQRRF